MARLAACLEGLDDEHAAAAAWARMRERLRRIGVVHLLSFCRSIGRGWGQVQELTHSVDRFGAIAAGEQAVVADAVEALGQDVDEETADELAVSGLAVEAADLELRLERCGLPQSSQVLFARENQPRRYPG